MALPPFFLVCPPNIYGETSSPCPGFFDKVAQDLIRINTSFTGGRLIQKILKNASPIFIRFGTRDTALALPPIEHWKPVLITFNAEDDGSTPSFIKLAHELIHAYHFMRAKVAVGEDRVDVRVWSNNEEYQTIVGFPTKKKMRFFPKITENSIRLETGYVPRRSYARVDDSKKLVDLSPIEFLTAVFGMRASLISDKSGA